MSFRVQATILAPVLMIEPEAFQDERGFFLETFHQLAFEQAGLPSVFVQDNHSFSHRNVLRGIHYQVRKPQGKLVRVIAGEIFDVAVDLRKGSPTLGRWAAERLSGQNHRMLWLPPGFGHAFLVLSPEAHVSYKVTSYYSPADERCIRWNDLDIGIEWPIPAGECPILSVKDGKAPLLGSAELLSGV